MAILPVLEPYIVHVLSPQSMYYGHTYVLWPRCMCYGHGATIIACNKSFCENFVAVGASTATNIKVWLSDRNCASNMSGVDVTVVWLALLFPTVIPQRPRGTHTAEICCKLQRSIGLVTLGQKSRILNMYTIPIFVLAVIVGAKNMVSGGGGKIF